MKTLTILSGKGGVGKSSISASLAVMLSKEKKIVCSDCDVDATNLALVFGAKKFQEWKDLSTNLKAVFDLEKCKSCKKCVNACYFDAIAWKNNYPELKEYSCEGCKACELVCPYGAITMEKVNNAKIGYADSGRGFKVASAQLNVGESGSGKVVYEVREKAKEVQEGAELMVIDSAAGIGCPVIASVTGADYALLVTEPTPSGFSDMKKAIEVVNHFRIPYAIIINKFDLNAEFEKKIEEFAEQNKVEVVAKIPFDKKFAYALTEMVPIVEFDSTYEKVFEKISQYVLEKLFN